MGYKYSGGVTSPGFLSAVTSMEECASGIDYNKSRLRHSDPALRMKLCEMNLKSKLTHLILTPSSFRGCIMKQHLLQVCGNIWTILDLNLPKSSRYSKGRIFIP